MNYEFHVGDYVETLEEKLGYIEKIQLLSDDKTCLYITFRDGRTYPYDMNEEGLKFRFKRIGQYDFTKKDEEDNDKIKPLVKSWVLDENGSRGEYYFSREVIKKINDELVKAVNHWRRGLMKWHKVEDYPVGSDEYVFVSAKLDNKRLATNCFVAKKQGDYWSVNGEDYYIDSTDRWCYIDLPED